MMPVSGGGFDQCYNAQASVDIESMLIVGQHLSQNTNDRLEITPALKALAALPKSLGALETLLADTGYFSETNVESCQKEDVSPLISVNRDKHNQTILDRFSESPPLPEDAIITMKMRHQLQTQAGRALYAKRKSTVEPVFGIIKEVLGFRQFLLRGVKYVQGE
jgi:hypothetical protein